MQDDELFKLLLNENELTIQLRTVKHLCFERSVADSAIQSYMFSHWMMRRSREVFVCLGIGLGGGGVGWVGKRPVDD